MAAAAEVDSKMAKVALEFVGDISASQEEILARSSFLGGDNGFPASPSASDEEEEVFATPLDATQQQDEPVIMCTLPFTPTKTKTKTKTKSPEPPSHAALAPPSSQPQPQPPAPPPSSSPDDAAPVNPRRKPRIGVRKVRGARISTPSPSPEQQEEPEQPIHADPLVRAVLTIPTRATTTTATTSNSTQDPVEEFLALARRKGLI